MVTSMHTIRCLCAVTLLAVAPSLLAAQQGYYRWKDDAGAEHFTQQPPPGRKSDFIAVSTGKSTEVAPGQTAESQDNSKAGGTDHKVTGPIQSVPDKDPEKCKEAQGSQAVLNSHARIREKVGDDYRYLTPEEIAEQKKLAQESVDVYCEPAPAK